MEWEKYEEVECMGFGYTEYINKARTHFKRVWYDGMTEIYELENVR